VSVLEIPGKTSLDAGDFQQQQIAEFDLGSKRSRRSALAVLYVQLNVSFLDRVQRSSKGAIKGSTGNNFPHFQPQLLYNGHLSRANAIAIPLSETPRVIRFKVSPKKFHSVFVAPSAHWRSGSVAMHTIGDP
jgi:hypothetical protein